MANGTLLCTSNSGTPISITYGTNGPSVSTNELTVNANSSNNFIVNFTFQVGSTQNATKLSPNVHLAVGAKIINNQTVSQDMIFMVVLYDTKGNISKKYSTNKQVSANGSTALTGDIDLPSSVTGYTAKAFVWQGTDILSSSLTPLCNSAQISG